MIVSTIACFVAFSSLSTSHAQQPITAAVPPTPANIPTAPSSLQQWTLGIQGQSTGRSIEVIQVFPGSAAERLLLEAGDRIVSINGNNVRTMADLRNQLSQAGRFNGGNIRVIIDNVRARHGEPGAQRYVSHSTYLSSFNPGGLSGTGPAVVTPNTIDRFNYNTGGFDTSNLQIDHSANQVFRDASRNNGTLRKVRRPIYGPGGNVIGYQEGQVWRNSLTGQEHGDLNNFTPNQHGGVHRQREIKSIYPGK